MGNVLNPKYGGQVYPTKLPAAQHNSTNKPNTMNTKPHCTAELSSCPPYPKSEAAETVHPLTTPARDIKEVEIKSVPCLSVGLSTLGGFAIFPMFAGFYTVEPNEVKAITHFGQLTRMVSEEGLHWEWYAGMDLKSVSVKQLTMDLPHSKIVDSRGTPVMVSAIVNYRVIDAKKALFSVENYKNYVKVNSTAILKQVVGQHSYDELKTHADDVNEALREAVQRQVSVAGIHIISVSMNELNYAPEIAGSMLRKQQAGALVEARQQIVEGAVKISHDAIAQLEKAQTMNMTNEDKVKIVTNLLTVTCSETDATPTVSC